MKFKYLPHTPHSAGFQESACRSNASRPVSAKRSFCPPTKSFIMLIRHIFLSKVLVGWLAHRPNLPACLLACPHLDLSASHLALDDHHVDHEIALSSVASKGVGIGLWAGASLHSWTTGRSRVFSASVSAA